VAEKLGKYVHEIEQEMTIEELHGWIAWEQFKAEEEKKAADRAKRKKR